MRARIFKMVKGCFMMGFSVEAKAFIVNVADDPKRMEA
jgi:hypothetical protein